MRQSAHDARAALATGGPARTIGQPWRSTERNHVHSARDKLPSIILHCVVHCLSYCSLALLMDTIHVSLPQLVFNLVGPRKKKKKRPSGFGASQL